MIKTFIKMSNESYERALAWASKEGEIDVVKLLLANGADPNGCYRYALKQASMNGHLDIVRILLENGANLHGCLALEYACQNGYHEIVKLLLEYGADPTAINNQSIKWAIQHSHHIIIKLLLEHGADVNVALQYANTSQWRELIIQWKYRPDGQEYQKARESL